MLLESILATTAFAAQALAQTYPSVPLFQVPACPSKGTVSYSKSVPEQADFPLTQVDACYDAQALHLTFTAYNETNFFFNASQGTNDAIWAYEVMEAFIARGTNDPQTYLEFEVNPNNATFQAFIYNPSKTREAGAPFDTAFLQTPIKDGLTAETTLDRPGETWVSEARIPLGLFNVDDGAAKGTEWRMNFFRTVTSESTYPDQLLGSWSPVPRASFHMTPYFGRVVFV